MSEQSKYWFGKVPLEDDFGSPITDEFVDGRAKLGMWGLMTPANWKNYGYCINLGTGLGQRYRKQPDGRWLKVEG